MSRSHRGTIFVEDAEILSQEAHPASQYVLRLAAPRLAAHAVPGSFAHLQCDPGLAMRRPMSVMRVDPTAGWAEFLYKVVGHGTALLAARPRGARVSVLGPIGRGFVPCPDRPRSLVLGGGVGIPPMVFLAERLHRDHPEQRPLVIIGSEVPFPFPTPPSRMAVGGLPAPASSCMPLVESWGIQSRLASLQEFPGTFRGYVTDLASTWLGGLSDDERARVAVYACGPTPMLRASAALAARYDLPCQVCLEEFMACAVGGCAGCAMRLRLPEGEAMKRVCVDGPVFDAASVVWDAIPPH